MTESNLVKHARAELYRAGLFDPDSDYGGMIGKDVLDIVKLFAKQDHSGGSAALTITLLNQLLEFRPLSDLTSDPAEWMEVVDGLWQSRRDAAAFSRDGGRTYKRNGDPHTYTSTPHEESHE